ncbi:MAG: 16S rRNA (adenine(1518)-N(6)/adenine(1519)-N(6))-dimethyltransferase RsmA [Pseudomonadota bacterium]
MKTHRPRKRFGQHFLKDPGVIDAILRAIAPAKTDTLVEIGPGLGALTGSLARTAGSLHLVELDRDLAAGLRKRWAEDESVTVHEADALRFDFAALGDDLRIVGNLPYNISTPLLFHLLEQRRAVRDLHFMLQKEVVDRIAAVPGNKAWGRLSVMLQTWLTAESLFDVEPEAFDPPPAVRSAVVRLYPRAASAAQPDDADFLSKLLSSAFAQRRKTLRNALRGIADETALEGAGIDPSARAETVDVAAWIRLSNRLASGG